MEFSQAAAAAVAAAPLINGKSVHTCNIMYGEETRAELLHDSSRFIYKNSYKKCIKI